MASMETLQYHFPGMYIYEGAVMPHIFPAHKADEAREYNFTNSDVLVATYPKSGTTWMQEVTWLLLNESESELAKTTPLDDRCLFLEFEDPDPKKRAMQDKLQSPKVIKTHLHHNILENAIKKGNPRVLVVLRNPKDVLVSQYHFYRMNQSLGCFSGSWDQFFAMFKNKELIFGYWYDHAKGWWQERENPNYHFVKYEDMKMRPMETLTELAEFLKVSVSHQTLEKIMHHTSFDQMRGNEMVNKEGWKRFDSTISKFMRKGVIGDWKNHFSQEQSEFVDSLCDNLKGDGLTFDFD